MAGDITTFTAPELTWLLQPSKHWAATAVTRQELTINIKPRKSGWGRPRGAAVMPQIRQISRLYRFPIIYGSFGRDLRGFRKRFTGELFYFSRPSRKINTALREAGGFNPSPPLDCHKKPLVGQKENCIICVIIVLELRLHPIITATSQHYCLRYE